VKKSAGAESEPSGFQAANLLLATLPDVALGFQPQNRAEEQEFREFLVWLFPSRRACRSGKDWKADSVQVGSMNMAEIA
jgi:hypothetical protein